jgi:hypothetical protein
MKRLIAAFPHLRTTLFIGTVLLASHASVNLAHSGQLQPETALGYVKMSTVVAAESNKNMLNVGLDKEAYVTVHKGDLVLRLGYSLPDLAKEDGAGINAGEQGRAPTAGGVMVKLSFAF